MANQVKAQSEPLRCNIQSEIRTNLNVLSSYVFRALKKQQMERYIFHNDIDDHVLYHAFSYDELILKTERKL